MNARTQQKRLTRQRIYDAGIIALEQSGYKNTTIAQITKSAQVAKGTFYVHFDSLEELVDEALAEFNQQFVEQALPILHDHLSDDQPDFISLLDDISTLFCTHWSINRQRILVFIQRFATTIEPDQLAEGFNPEATGLLHSTLSQYEPWSRMPEAQRGLLVQSILSVWLRLGMHLVSTNHDEIMIQHIRSALVSHSMALLYSV